MINDQPIDAAPPVARRLDGLARDAKVGKVPRDDFDLVGAVLVAELGEGRGSAGYQDEVVGLGEEVVGGGEADTWGGGVSLIEYDLLSFSFSFFQFFSYGGGIGYGDALCLWWEGRKIEIWKGQLRGMR